MLYLFVNLGFGVVVELALFFSQVTQHLAHEMRLVDLGKPQSYAVGALIKPKGYGNCDSSVQAAVAATFTKVFEQYIAAQ